MATEVRDDLLLSDEEIAELSPEQLERYHQALTELKRTRGSRPWSEIARPAQLAPEGDWYLWLLLAGRGWGKTRTGAEWTAEKARRYPGARIALVGQTFADGRDTMVEGESGLLSVLRDDELRGGSRGEGWNRSIGELYLANGSRFRVFSSEKPNRLRGPQHHFAWGDEPATWLDAHLGPTDDTTWSNLELGLRVSIDGSEPQAVLTGTPRPVRLLTQQDPPPPGLLHRPGTLVTRGHTDENLTNLARSFRERVIEPLRDTRLGRQELAAEILEEVEGSLWNRETLDRLRVSAAPAGGWQSAPAVGVDPSDGTAGGAEHAFSVVALGMDHGLYLVESEGMRCSVTDFAKRSIEAARRHGGRLVIEANHGGKWLEEVFDRVMIDEGVRVPLETVHAAQGKRTRAEPIAALSDQGHFHHIGFHPELEEQLTGWDGSGASPDRLDSYVWAAWKFTGYSFGPPSAGEGKVHPYTDRPVAGVHRWSESAGGEEDWSGALEEWVRNAG